MAKAKKTRRGGKPKAARKTRKAAAKRRTGPGIKPPDGGLKPANPAPALTPTAAALGGTAIRQPDGGLIRAAEPADSNDNRRPGIKQPDGGL